MINIFFGSSLLKKTEEKDALELFIRKINTEFSEITSSIDINIKPLFKNELNDINKLIEKSEYTFFVIYKSIEDEENDEIDKAVRNYELNNKPKVYVYFKNVEDLEEVEESIVNLQNKIANEFSHYYQMFDNIDEIKLRLIENVFSDKLKDSLVIDNNSLKFEGIDLSKYIDYTLLPEFKNNKELQDLYSEYKGILDEYNDAINKDSSDDFFHLEKLYAKKEVLREKLKDKEQKILALSIKLIELKNKSVRNEDIEKAALAFEQGNMKDCIEALNLGRSSRLIKEAYSLKDKAMFEENQAKYNITWAIKERRIVIDLLLATDNVENKDKLIENLYEENATLAIDFEVELDEAFSYVEYLVMQGKIEDAKSFIVNLEELIEEKSERKYPLLYAKLYNLFGLISLSNKNQEDSTSYYKDALNYYLMQEEGKEEESYLYGLYKNYFNLANSLLLNIKDNEEELVKYYSEAILICEKLCSYNFGKYAKELANIYMKYTMLPSVKIDSKYEEFYKRLVNYYKSNTESTSNVENLADSLGTLGNYYLLNGSMYDAIKYLEEASSYYDTMKVISTNELRQKIGVLHNQIALIKKQTHSYEESLKHQEKAYEYTLIAFKENHLYSEIYFTALYNLIVMYNSLYPNKAYGLLNELYTLIDSLYKKHPEQVREYSLFFYSQLCGLYLECNESDLSNEIYDKFITIYEDALKVGLNYSSFNTFIAVYTNVLYLIGNGSIDKALNELGILNEIISTLMNLDSKHCVKMFQFLLNINNAFNALIVELQEVFAEKEELTESYLTFVNLFTQCVTQMSSEEQKDEIMKHAQENDVNKIIESLIANLEAVKSKEYETETMKCEQIIKGYVTFLSSVSGSMLLDEETLEQYMFEAFEMATECNYKYPDICVNESSTFVNFYTSIYTLDMKNKKGVEIVKKYIDSELQKFNKGVRVIPYYSNVISNTLDVLDELRYVFGERKYIIDCLSKIKSMFDYMLEQANNRFYLEIRSKYYLLCSKMFSDDRKIYHKQNVDMLYEVITTTSNDNLINNFNESMYELMDFEFEELTIYIDKILTVLDILIEKVNKENYQSLVDLLNEIGNIMLDLEVEGADEFFVLANKIKEEFEEDDLAGFLNMFS